MKDYLRRKMCDMTDEQKEEFLKTVSAELQIRLAEGNPAQDSKVELEGTLPVNLIIKIRDDSEPTSPNVQGGTSQTV
jgi:hypothetical protein